MWGIGLDTWNNIIVSFLVFGALAAVIVGIATYVSFQLQKQEAIDTANAFARFKVESAKQIAAAEAAGEAAKAEAAKANERTAELQIELKKQETARLAMLDQLKPRDLNAEQIEKFSSAIRGHIQDIAVFTLSDAETWQYAIALVEALKLGGAHAQLMAPPFSEFRLDGISSVGLTIYEYPFRGDSGPGMALFGAFAKLNLAGSLHTPPKPLPDIPSLALFVALKPPAFMGMPGYMRAKFPEFHMPAPDWEPKP